MFEARKVAHRKSLSHVPAKVSLIDSCLCSPAGMLKVVQARRPSLRDPIRLRLEAPISRGSALETTTKASRRGLEAADDANTHHSKAAIKRAISRV